MILDLVHIKFGFTSNNLLFDDLSLSLEKGKIYALMGNNGAGKTTLFNIITGFIKPHEGQVFFNNIDITHNKPYKINRRGIGRTFQDLRLISGLTVKENLILAFKNNPSDFWLSALLPTIVFKRFAFFSELKSKRIAKQFFLQDVTNSLASEISFGQQKLLNLACCVANGSALLLIDEAVAGIQPEYRKKIGGLIKQLKTAGKTVFLIEHNTDFISEVADQIFFLQHGNISSYNNIESIKNDKLVMDSFI